MQFNKGIAGAPIAAIAATKDTATNPFVVDAFVLVIIADGARPSDHGHASLSMDTTTARRNPHEISLAAAQLGKITPIADSYISPASSVKNRRQQQLFLYIQMLVYRSRYRMPLSVSCKLELLQFIETR